jgi:hypothetical protein
VAGGQAHAGELSCQAADDLGPPSLGPLLSGAYDALIKSGSSILDLTKLRRLGDIWLFIKIPSRGGGGVFRPCWCAHDVELTWFSILRILKKKRGFPFYEVNGEGNTKLLVFALNLPAMCHESMVSFASKSENGRPYIGTYLYE